MDISGRDMDIRNEIVFQIYRPVVQIKKAFRFTVADHVSAVGVGLAHFNFFFFFHFLSRF
ncbi:hypothetical protein D3C80_1212730 [compost metagenome]